MRKTLTLLILFVWLLSDSKHLVNRNWQAQNKIYDKDSISFKDYKSQRIHSLTMLINLELKRKNNLTNIERKDALDRINKLKRLRNLHLNNVSLSECLYASLCKAYKNIGNDETIYFVEGVTLTGETNLSYVYSSKQETIDSMLCNKTNYKWILINDSVINQCKEEIPNTDKFNFNWFVVTALNTRGVNHTFYVQPNSYMRKYFKYFF